MEFCASRATEEYLCEGYLPPMHKLKISNTYLIILNLWFYSTLPLIRFPM